MQGNSEGCIKFMRKAEICSAVGDLQGYKDCIVYCHKAEEAKTDIGDDKKKIARLKGRAINVLFPGAEEIQKAFFNARGSEDPQSSLAFYTRALQLFNAYLTSFRQASKACNPRIEFDKIYKKILDERIVAFEKLIEDREVEKQTKQEDIEAASRLEFSRDLFGAEFELSNGSLFESSSKTDVSSSEEGEEFEKGASMELDKNFSANERRVLEFLANSTRTRNRTGSMYLTADSTRTAREARDLFNNKLASVVASFEPEGGVIKVHLDDNRFCVPEASWRVFSKLRSHIKETYLQKETFKPVGADEDPPVRETLNLPRDPEAFSRLISRIKNQARGTSLKG